MRGYARPFQPRQPIQHDPALSDARRPRKPRRGRPAGKRPARRGKPSSSYGVRRLEDDQGWALTPPPCARERADDLDEVRLMVDAGETEIATDELRWLLSGCPDLMEAHVLLGQLALEADEAKPASIELARGHYGYAFQVGEKALKQSSGAGPLPGAEPANAPWYEAARGLAWCFEKQQNPAMADRIAATAKKHDPSDPAEIVAMLDELRAGGLPIVELG